MPAPNHLNSEQKEKLQKALKKEENPYIRERVLILLLLNDGKTQVQISKLIGCSLRTVSYWCIHGEANNLDSLKDKRMEGNYRKATDEYIKILLETIDKEPQEMGYEFGRWTAKRLATYLTEQTGIELSSSQVTNILKKKKYVYIWALVPDRMSLVSVPLQSQQFREKRTKTFLLFRLISLLTRGLILAPSLHMPNKSLFMNCEQNNKGDFLTPNFAQDLTRFND